MQSLSMEATRMKLEQQKINYLTNKNITLPSKKIEVI
ncbi:hypothetical protein OTSGILL_2326 [Orientia tsutsugamushi str. Gilliam]|uniref:Uncharacterized protein n=1 Tax=Orientia tsutsugamushi str. Gilliam TaxID=1359184 RepID=A0A0F3M9S6_ORITS|nr:hypothetical protein OTSGILL_2326 [Orientia tsutsugamushi str. Gilliam]